MTARDWLTTMATLIVLANVLRVGWELAAGEPNRYDLYAGAAACVYLASVMALERLNKIDRAKRGRS